MIEQIERTDAERVTDFLTSTFYSLRNNGLILTGLKVDKQIISIDGSSYKIELSVSSISKNKKGEINEIEKENIGITTETE